MPTQGKNTRRGVQTDRGQGHRPRGRTKSPEDRKAVPILLYGTDGNFQLWKKKTSLAALEKYGDLGRLFDLSEYFSPPTIEIEDYDLDEDPHGLNLSEYKDARKERNRHIAKMKADRSAMYAFMLSNMSNESLDAIKLLDGWPEADELKGPLTL